jgi:Xaa-Pro aminopeptidase
MQIDPKERVREIQKALGVNKIDGWLFYDFRHSDPIAYRILGLPEAGIATRRWFYYIPAHGEPTRIVHKIESAKLDSLPGISKPYAGWEALDAALRTALRGGGTIAMQYSPMNSIPYISRVDGGTLEQVRSMGVQIVSSADLVQQFEAVWTGQQWRDHQEAAEGLIEIVKETFAHAAKAILGGKPESECGLQRFVLERMAARNLVTDHPPIVAVNAHSADPHYAPDPKTDIPLREGDFLLLDLWAKPNRPGSVYADFTWTAFAGKEVPRKHRDIFNVVVGGRDAAIAFLEEVFADGREVHGWEVDSVCRREIAASGYGDFFVHRTGHSIGEDDHGNGANIDGLETRDDRVLIPGTCFSIEPGVYLPGEFGVRSEVNVYIAPDGVVHVTGSPIQREVVALLA